MKEIKNKGSDNQNPRLKTINHYAENLTRPQMIVPAAWGHVIAYGTYIATDNLGAFLLLGLCCIWIASLSRPQSPLGVLSKAGILSALVIVETVVFFIAFALAHP